MSNGFVPKRKRHCRRQGPVVGPRKKEGFGMNIRRFVAALATCLTLGGAATVVGSAPASAATPISNGCPAGFQLLSVSTLSAEGYHAPGLVDDPNSGILSYGRPGNGDGLVCGVQLGHQTTSFGLPIYDFIDNTLPAS
jgi:hypothetical protein